MSDQFIFDDTFDDDNEDFLPTGKDRFPLVENDKGGYTALPDWMYDPNENPDGHDVDEIMGLGCGTWGDD